MLSRRYMLNKISKLRQELREEIQLIFSLYAKKSKPTSVSPDRIIFFNHITKQPELSRISSIQLQKEDTIINPKVNELMPIKLSEIMSIDDLLTLHKIALQLEGVKK